MAIVKVIYPAAEFRGVDILAGAMLVRAAVGQALLFQQADVLDDSHLRGVSVILGVGGRHDMVNRSWGHQHWFDACPDGPRYSDGTPCGTAGMVWLKFGRQIVINVMYNFFERLTGEEVRAIAERVETNYVWPVEYDRTQGRIPFRNLLEAYAPVYFEVSGSSTRSNAFNAACQQAAKVLDRVIMQEAQFVLGSQAVESQWNSRALQHTLYLENQIRWQPWVPEDCWFVVHPATDYRFILQGVNRSLPRTWFGKYDRAFGRLARGGVFCDTEGRLALFANNESAMIAAEKAEKFASTT